MTRSVDPFREKWLGRTLEMPSREFRFEYIRDVVFEDGEIENRREGAYDSGTGYSPVTVVFRAKDDGKFYEFGYQHNSEHGIYDCFENFNDDTVVTLQEVEKVEITTTKWLAVPDARVDLTRSG
jgi:hypothetical protein